MFVFSCKRVGEVRMAKKKRLVFGASILITMLVFMQTSAVFAALSLEDVTTWYWTDDTIVLSTARGDVDGDGEEEIITGGSFHDGTRDVAQLVVWDGATLALEDVITWYWIDYTCIYSVAVGDVDDDSDMEIITAGIFYDDTGLSVAQLVVWGCT
jgi:hypothetical protein